MDIINKKIIVGSLNKTKVNAIKSLFPHDQVEGIAAPSNVSRQPTSNEMTRLGALNRAKYGLHKNKVHYSIGLEGGVTYINEDLYLCNWGALVTYTGKTYTASGGLLPLPKSFMKPLLQGEELATIMDCFTNKQAIGSNEGAIGVFTAGAVSREQLYKYIGILLKGQLDYGRK